MLARIAHELFWLGRYVARAEHRARMLEGIYAADLQARPDDPAGVVLSWESLLAIMGMTGEEAGDHPADRDRMLALMFLDPARSESVLSCVTRAREGARTVRDVISAEMWEAINSFHLELAERTGEARIEGGPYSLASFVKEHCALFWGLTARTMLRDEAYAFLDAGGRFESADMVLRMLRVALPPADEGEDGDGEASPPRDGQALALLQAVGGLQAYRRAVTSPPNAAPVARFLLFTRSYPDSVAASVEAVRRALSDADVNPRSSEPVLRLSRLSADLEFRGGLETPDRELLEACEAVGHELALTDSDIAQRYFGGAQATERHLPV